MSAAKICTDAILDRMKDILSNGQVASRSSRLESAGHLARNGELCLLRAHCPKIQTGEEKLSPGSERYGSRSATVTLAVGAASGATRSSE